MKKLTIILLTISISACSNLNKCYTINTYKNNYGNINLEFDSNPDSSFRKAVNFAKLYITDSLNQKPQCYQYNFSTEKNDSTEFVVIQIFDKRKIIKERSELDSKIHKRLNRIVDLYFDINQSYIRSMSVADTKKEQKNLTKDIKQNRKP